MKFSEKWLREWVNPAGTTSELAEKLTMAGLEIESISPIGQGFSNIRIGKVLAAEQHPNADRLRVCTVSVDDSQEPLTIVCGGANVRAGLKVPVAMIGATFPSGLVIKPTKLRGVDSQGMICSTSELQLTETSEGIMELPEDAPLGMDILNYLQIPDQIIDVNLTPNRSDCLSIQGLARETAALYKLPINPPSQAVIPAQISDSLEVKVENPQACPRYLGRIIRGINSQQTTPLWMQEKLRRSGLRSIHPVVDITNYVMLELGQPLHAFDLKQINGAIQVRSSRPDETITLLDGQTLSLAQPSLLIADQDRALALAGIMGGLDSGVSETTQDIFLESAFFSPDSISQTLRRLNLQSDSAHRFERGVDPELPRIAMERASELILNIVGGQAGPITEITSDQIPKPAVINLRRARIARILGVQLTDTEVVDILSGLGMRVSSNAEGWQVEAPSYRFDMHLEVDLIEELGRIYGYDHIPCRYAAQSLKMLPVKETEFSSGHILQFLSSHGYHESICYSFIDPKLSQLLFPDIQAIPLANPISEDMSVMRPSLWPGLLQAAMFNLNRQQAQIRLFEIGVCFNIQGTSIEQKPHLAGIITGPISPEQWNLGQQTADFYDLKGDITALLQSGNAVHEFSFSPASHPALHPGRSAMIQRDGNTIGHLGELHPQVHQQLGLSAPVYLFELQLAEMRPIPLPDYTSPSKFPSIRRDIAFTVAETTSYQLLLSSIRASAGENLQTVQLFDIYRGAGIPAGQKSMALGLTFQSASRTLVDSEVDQSMSRIVLELQQQHQAALRE